MKAPSSLSIPVALLRVAFPLIEGKHMPSAFSDRDGITFNLRGVFSFPIEEYSPQLLPSLATPKSRAVGV